MKLFWVSIFIFWAYNISYLRLSFCMLAERTQNKPAGGKCGAGDAAGSPPEPTWVHEIFQGILTSETRCLNCETVSSKDEDFFDLQVDVDQNTSITHCLRCFSNTETLCSDNKFKCDHCSSYQEAQVLITQYSTCRLLNKFIGTRIFCVNYRNE